jgi:hypothetical protein
MPDVNKRKGWVRRNSVLWAQFFCKPKTGQKMSINFKNTQKKKKPNL